MTVLPKWLKLKLRYFYRCIIMKKSGNKTQLSGMYLDAYNQVKKKLSSADNSCVDGKHVSWIKSFLKTNPIIDGDVFIEKLNNHISDTKAQPEILQCIETSLKAVISTNTHVFNVISATLASDPFLNEVCSMGNHVVGAYSTFLERTHDSNSFNTIQLKVHTSDVTQMIPKVASVSISDDVANIVTKTYIDEHMVMDILMETQRQVLQLISTLGIDKQVLSVEGTIDKTLSAIPDICNSGAMIVSPSIASALIASNGFKSVIPQRFGGTKFIGTYLSKRVYVDLHAIENKILLTRHWLRGGIPFTPLLGNTVIGSKEYITGEDRVLPTQDESPRTKWTLVYGVNTDAPLLGNYFQEVTLNNLESLIGIDDKKVLFS